MKLAQGETLRDIMYHMRGGNPEYLETYNTFHLLTIFRKVCDAVSYAHSMGIIHQDIKPNNIIVGRYGQVFLIDWGTAKIMTNLQEEPDPVKRDFLVAMEPHAQPQSRDSVRIQGSPAYMSPEQAGGAVHLLDQRSDIFLLGSTLYTMFTLQLPYIGKSPHEVVQKAKLRKLVPPQLRSPDKQIPEEICRVIMKAMAYKQEDRYQTVEELSEDVDQLIAGKWRQQKNKVFKTGAMLMQEGDIGEEAYLILSGSVLVTKEMSGTKVVLGTYQRGEIIGEMSLISDKPRSATVQALEKTTVAVLTKQLLSDHLKKLPPYMEKIISALTDRLQQTDSMLHPHLTSDCTGVVLKHLRLIFKDKSEQPHTLALPFQDVVEEIAQDLGLPQEKVRNVLAQAISLKLLFKQNDTLQIPDMSQLMLHSDPNA
jgi:serine/threonine-protein kinase